MADGLDVYKGLPRKVKVGPYTIAIKLMPAKWREDNKCYGCYYESELIIKLCTNQPSLEFAVDTLIHELMHAIYKAYHFRRADDEERTCGALATALLQVFRDNPRLMTWIIKHT